MQVSNPGFSSSTPSAAAVDPIARDVFQAQLHGIADEINNPLQSAAGHLQLLEQARSLGSTLVVGINADESVRKGPGRPVNTADDRAAMLRALRVVDRVVVFEEPTPEALIRMLRPDVYVKGDDYTPESLPEAQAVIDIGGTIALLPLLDGYSTTSTLQRMGYE